MYRGAHSDTELRPDTSAGTEVWPDTSAGTELGPTHRPALNSGPTHCHAWRIDDFFSVGVDSQTSNYFIRSLNSFSLTINFTVD